MTQRPESLQANDPPALPAGFHFGVATADLSERVGASRFEGLEVQIAEAITRGIFGDAAAPLALELRQVRTRDRQGRLRAAWGWLGGVVHWFEERVREFSLTVTCLNSNWWHLGMAGWLPELVCPPECVGRQDFIGLDYYWGVGELAFWRIPALASAAELGRFDRSPVWAGGLYNKLRWLHGVFPGQAVLIVENGSVPSADNVSRSSYLTEHLREVRRAVADGVNVVGYICWSITSNREWGHRFGPGNDFGLFHVGLDQDPSQLKRVETADAAVYRDLIAGRGVPGRSDG